MREGIEPVRKSPAPARRGSLLQMRGPGVTPDFGGGLRTRWLDLSPYNPQRRARYL